MSNTKANNDGKNSTSSKKIIEMLECVNKRLEDIEQMISLGNGNMTLKLDEILEKPVSNSGRSSTRSKTVKNEAVSISPEKKHSNSLLWFKASWKENRDEIVKTYCTDEMMEALAEHMKNDPVAKAKSGPAKDDAEVAYIWNTYVKPKPCIALREKIKTAFDKYNETKNKSNMKLARKDSESKDD